MVTKWEVESFSSPIRKTLCQRNAVITGRANITSQGEKISNDNLMTRQSNVQPEYHQTVTLLVDTTRIVLQTYTTHPYYMMTLFTK